MSTAIGINWNEIQQLREKKVVNPSPSFDEIAAKLRKAARQVKQEWNDYSTEDREKLKNIAYGLIEPSKTSFNLWQEVRTIAFAIFLAMTNQRRSFYSCIEALDLLIDNILDAVERDDSSYQTVLSDTLEQLYLDQEQGQEIGAEETREWLHNLSDKALRQI